MHFINSIKRVRPYILRVNFDENKFSSKLTETPLYFFVVSFFE